MILHIHTQCNRPSAVVDLAIGRPQPNVVVGPLSDAKTRYLGAGGNARFEVPRERDCHPAVRQRHLDEGRVARYREESMKYLRRCSNREVKI